MASMKIKKGDTVQVLTGKDKGATGKVIAVNRETSRVTGEGVNRVTRHTKAGQRGLQVVAQPRAHRSGHRDMGNAAGIEEALVTLKSAVDELVDDDKGAGREFFLQ